MQTFNTICIRSVNWHAYFAFILDTFVPKLFFNIISAMTNKVTAANFRIVKDGVQSVWLQSV